MDVARATVALALACAACAQQVSKGSITGIHCDELTGRLAERHGPTFDRAAFILALQSLLERALQQDDPQASVQLSRMKTLYVWSKVPATHELAQRAFEAVRAGTLEVRVQCTVFTLPASAVRQGRIADVVPVDEVVAGRMLKTVVAAGGTIQNLRETGAASLVPFAVQARLASTSPRPAADAPTVPPRDGPAVPPTTTAGEIHCRALVLGDDEAALSVSLAGIPRPGGELFVRLKVGAGAMLTFRGAEHANCVWLRVVSLQPIEPGSTPGASPPPLRPR